MQPLIQDEKLSQELELVISITASQLLDGVDFDSYLEWAQESLPVLMPNLFSEIPSLAHNRTAYWTAVNLWNSAPQPNNHYQPCVVPTPGRNDVCPCGSGQKFKRCCKQVPEMGFSSVFFWDAFASVMTKKGMLDEVRSGSLPIIAVRAFAENSLLESDYLQTMKIIEFSLDSASNAKNKIFDELLFLYCTSCDEHYQTDRKKKIMLKRMSAHDNVVIRSSAWQRLATIYQDEGNYQDALDALSHAMRATPNDYEIALLELTLLMANHKDANARQRATFWYKKLLKFKDTPMEVLDALHHAQHDPHAIFANTLHGYPEIGIFELMLGWAEDNRNHKIERYSLTPPSGNNGLERDNDADLDDGERQWRDKSDNILANSVQLIQPSKLQKLELIWQQCSPKIELLSTQSINQQVDDLWEDLDGEKNIEWMDFLIANPDAINLFGVLDTVTTLIHSYPFRHDLEASSEAMASLCARAVKLVQHSGFSTPNTMPWMILENRPVLRLYAHRIEHCEAADTINYMKDYISINPFDNHGYREVLANEYLKNNANQQVLDLCQQYPQDIMPGIIYGRLLANLRLGNTNEIQHDLQICLQQLPKVAEHLVTARIKKPKDLRLDFITVGGDDQAWFYRQEMRSEWQTDKKIFNWLQNQLGDAAKNQADLFDP